MKAPRRDGGQGARACAPLATQDRKRKAKSITDVAEQEGVTVAYVCRLLPLTCLAPDLVEALLDGRHPKGLRLAELLGNGPPGWEEQRLKWGFQLHRPAPRRITCSANASDLDRAPGCARPT